ncbi:TetR/AcrR family transcriptional regulator [Geodermatophilus sp. TF02-6]|uniref:TetR/AcrR family transcriptional regulator n=1 Tax=Geodermatophilus sp. TF02-6 TaxID=2250575 RepID=UPI000DEA6FBE|nr:TetR/AcrR family transcriptional regulator [Geodermatophilus sp. TF02-6]RBY83777.1 TetR/AcrR family transcriptional regulator [Geodermatophilus sp. TF02-6]
MGGLRAAQKRMTRELLLTQALELFEAKGYAAVTVDEIAAAAGTTRQTFYQHFPSKSQLMQSLIETVDRMLTSSDEPPLTSAVASGDVEQLRAWLARKVDQWPDIRPYVMAAHEAAPQDGDIQAAITRWFEGAIGDIQAGLDRAGRFDPSSRRIRAVLAFGQLEFFSRRWFRTGWDVDRNQTVALLTDSWRSLLID